ncbi:TetR family transcriptional regulator C-terminal domain-containing protein [Ochrobactrum sp. CM-21-5]|nr:TetR family transcriptional regulator C-terminal domain-containing protein [Ochrobactrum sp. CM-21-5]MBC2884855.1 TetR family transcriptional regulator C-terminal domain-containing protein [Ochrobactrum sp. CM-21-5]
MPRTVDHGERRSTILEAFVRVAAREGLASLTLRSVAAEAGISLRLVQYYFETKAGLMQAGLGLLERESNRRWERRIAKLPQSPTAHLTLRALFEEALPTDETSRDFHLLWMSFAILAQTDPEISDRPFLDGPNRIGQRIAAILDQGKSDGEIHPQVDVEAEAVIFLGMLNGFATAVLVGQMTADAAMVSFIHQINRLSAT